jgi:tRNA-Thr(GGU) m(6)t(6)A37 methyltransferase TsaA
MRQEITLTPIGIVESAFNENTLAEEMRAHTSRIVINRDFEEGLLGLEAGKEIMVMFYLHKVAADDVELQLHPRHNPENPMRGVFATRTQFRPNKTGVTVARIEQVEGPVITVTGLDAQHGTPVLDIKPYAPYFDSDGQTQKLEVVEQDSLQACRDAIDLIDTEIIRLLGNRARYVHQVVKFKARPEDVPAPERYQAVMTRRRELAEANDLNPETIVGMYKLLIDNFIEEEIELIRRRDEERDNSSATR